VLVQDRGKSAHVFIADRIAILTQLNQDRFHIEDVPEDDHVQDEAKCAELIFLSFTVVLSQFAAFAVEDSAGDTVVSLALVELAQRGSALGFVVDVAGVPSENGR
jgi:hypothetical protein